MVILSSDDFTTKTDFDNPAGNAFSMTDKVHKLDY